MTYATTTTDQAANPYLQMPAPVVTNTPKAIRTSPGLAFLLGLIPGVGAIYNGQYLKGLLHVGVFGLLVSLVDRSGGAQPLTGLLTAGFYFYMPFEAFHTAKKRQLGLAADEWSSILPRAAVSGRYPIGPIVLIVLGVLFLLDELNWIRFYDVIRFWPVLLIALGAFMLYGRFSHTNGAQPVNYPPPVPQNLFPPAPAQPPAGVTQVEVHREQ